MTLPEFVNWAVAQGTVAKYNDGNFVGECVSIVNQYCWRVLNIPADAWGHAKDWATNFAPLSFFDKVSGTPIEGDILVYGANFGGGYGHIEIALGNNRALFQNRNGNRRVGTGTVLPGYVAILRKKVTKEGDKEMPLTPGQQDKALKMGLQREPRMDELNNPEWKANPGLLIDTLWGNGGEAIYKATKLAKSSEAITKDQVVDYIIKNLK